MTPERLIAHFDRISEAPDAIPRMRQFILDLAVRGKLVEQTHDDVPIHSEKLTAVRVPKQPKGRTGASLGTIAIEEIGFSVPESWRVARLFQLCDQRAPIVYGILQPGPNISPDGVSYVRPSEIEDGEIAINDVRQTSKEIAAKYSRSTIRTGDVIFTIVGTLGATAVVPDELDGGNITQSSCRLRVNSDLVERAFFVSALSSPCVTRQIARFKLGTAVPRLNIAHVRAIALPLPPLAEQRRIVAKVDELMALCDELEAAQAERERRRDRLAAASLARLNQPADDRQEFQRHVRFHLDHLRRFTTRPNQIPALRQTILNLAVPGFLTEVTVKGAFPQQPLGELVTVVRGSSPRPKGDPRYYGGNVPRLLIADITRDGKHVTPKLDFLTEEGAQHSRPMTKGSLVLAISGSYGVPAFLAVDACIHDGFIGFRDPSSQLDVEYLYLVMKYRKPYFDDVVKDSGLKNLTTQQLKQLATPLPPIAAQRRIVARVDELMAICDELESHLTTAETDRRRLLEAVLHEALNAAPLEPVARGKIRPLTLVALKFAARFPTWRIGGDRKRLVKSLAIAQRHLGVDFGWTDYQMSAGPHNPTLIKEIEAEATAHGLLEVEERYDDSHKSFRYTATPLPASAAQQLADHFGDKLDELNRLADLSSGWTSEQAELYATIYAVWNDLLIENKPATEPAIIAGVRNWSREKHGKFSGDDIAAALNRLREMNLVPRGSGRKTGQHEMPLLEGIEDV